jgi:hypothetical protein
MAGLAVLAIVLSVSLFRACGGSEVAQYDLMVRFHASVTQAEIKEARALLRGHDEGVKLQMTRCYPPMGFAAVATDAPDTVEALLEAESYVDDVSYEPSDQGEGSAAPRC